MGSCSASMAAGRPSDAACDHGIDATGLENFRVCETMGFLKPDMPVVDFAEWIKGSRSDKIRPMARHWAEVGFGTPGVMHLFYVVKILLYILAAWLIVLSTAGVDGFTDVRSRYAQPIVY